MSALQLTWKKLLALALIFTGTLSAQTIAPPAIEWQQSFGGTTNEYGRHPGNILIRQTPDGSYILSVHSYSGADGNKTTANFGKSDVWVLRLDPMGNKIWDQTYGGSGNDEPTDLIPAREGGWFIGCTSDSPASGNKTSPFTGLDDWIIRIDDIGNKVWEKTVGPTNCWLHWRMCLKQTMDNGLILARTSERTNGDGLEIHALRLDAEGNELWDRLLAARSFEASGHCEAIEETAEGHFLLAVVSFFNSGDPLKTSTNYGVFDYWLVCLDADGNKLWDHSFGGESDDWLTDMKLTSDGGALLAGVSKSVGGNKTSPYYGGGNQYTPTEADYWVVKVDGAGNKIWDQSYGGAGSESLYELATTADGGFVLVGCSRSQISGNKTSPVFGQTDGWVVRADRDGNKVWDQSFGGTNDDYITSVQQTRDGGFILAGYSNSDFGGNKTTPCFGGYDVWVIKLAPDALSAPRLRLHPEIQTSGARIFLSGVSNQLYRIDYSSDFLNWTPLQTNRASAVELEVVDLGATNSIRRFYRAQSIPE